MSEPISTTDERGELHGFVAEFDDVTSVTRAARAVRDAGYQKFDVYSPFPIHGIERAMGLRSTHLPWIVLVCGVSGLGLALLLQYWTNAVDYPFKISGKPLFGIPANIPITFEVTVLLSAFAAFFGMFILNKLPQHHHALFEHPRFRRATDDGFFLAIEAGDARFDSARTRTLLQSLTSHPVVACHGARGGDHAPSWMRAGGVALALLTLIPLAAAVAARSGDTTKPAFHIVNDMDSQARFRAQVANPIFADGRAMRPDPTGTVSFDGLIEDPVVLTGKQGEAWSTSLPVAADAKLLARGRERFGIYCAPCHGVAGYGDGLVANRAKDLQETNWVPPASLHDPLVRGRALGQLFDTVRNGVRTMPAYGRQLSVQDSWAVVAYVRALQRSQNGTPADVPEAKQAELGAR